MGKKSTKTKSTSGPPKWARPIIEGAAGDIRNVVSGNQGNLQQLAGQVGGFLPGLGEKAFGDNPALQAGMGYATDVLGGKYLDEGNPYLQGMIDKTDQSVRNQVNNLFARSGGSLGTQHAGILGRELAASENMLRGNVYAQERGAQQQAAGMLPGLNASQYAGIMPYLAATQTAGGLPYQGIQNLGQIGGLVGGYGTQTQTQPGGWGQAVLGAAMLPFFPSERRLKTKIELLCTDPDGLGWYRFAYRQAPDVMLEGVMIDGEDGVEKLRPHALGPVIGGMRTVNYAKIREAA